MPHRVLIVEDEENLLEALRYSFSREDFEVHTATDGATGLQIARVTPLDVVILDIILPEMDGIEVCRELRRTSTVPIIMLTAKGEEIDRIVGLEVGADDYVVKPFSVRELLARTRAILRRTRFEQENARVAPPTILRADDLELNQASFTARLHGQQLELPRRQFELLALLMLNRGRTLTREEILDRVWGYGYINNTRTIDVHVRWLRKKIEPDPSNPRSILTVRGVGYRFER